jgi:hypothetical protein
VDTSGGFTNPGVTGAGDVAPHANLTGQPISIFDPHGVQTLTGPSGKHKGNFYFNPAAFSNGQVGDGTCVAISPVCFPSTAQVVANPALRTYGTLPRNFFRGPGYTNLDVAFAKETAITERVKFTFRGDFFNAFNHTYFSNPSTNINSSRFGRITSVPRDSQRIIQLGAKISF